MKVWDPTTVESHRVCAREDVRAQVPVHSAHVRAAIEMAEGRGRATESEGYVVRQAS